MSRDRAKFKEKKIKDCLRYEKEAKELWKAQRNMPLIPLEKPIRHGWNRFYILRQDLQKHRHHKELAAILEIINTETWCDRKDFLRKSYRTGKLVPVEQDLRYLSEKEYEKLDEKLKPWFEKRQLRHRHWNMMYWVYVFTHPQFYVFKI
jgi:hypothetical protein